jgi:hypothetical protein
MPPRISAFPTGLYSLTLRCESAGTPGRRRGWTSRGGCCCGTGWSSSTRSGTSPTALQPPRANAIAERLIGTLRRECLDHLLSAGPRHLAAGLGEYIEHYDTTVRTDRSSRSRPQAAPIGPPLRPSGRCGETGLVAFYTNTCRSHNVTEFSASTAVHQGPTALRSASRATRTAGRTSLNVFV